MATKKFVLLYNIVRWIVRAKRLGKDRTYICASARSHTQERCTSAAREERQDSCRLSGKNALARKRASDRSHGDRIACDTPRSFSSMWLIYGFAFYYFFSFSIVLLARPPRFAAASMPGLFLSLTVSRRSFFNRSVAIKTKVKLMHYFFLHSLSFFSSKLFHLFKQKFILFIWKSPFFISYISIFCYDDFHFVFEFKTCPLLQNKNLIYFNSSNQKSSLLF